MTYINIKLYDGGETYCPKAEFIESNLMAKKESEKCPICQSSICDSGLHNKLLGIHHFRNSFHSRINQNHIQIANEIRSNHDLYPFI